MLRWDILYDVHVVWLYIDLQHFHTALLIA